jgi:hypothetical protein
MSPTPNGKISRLPHQQLVATEFAGHPISQANLSQWKKRNHPGWLNHQAALGEATRFMSESRQLSNAGEGTVTDNLATFVAAQYALASSQLAEEPDADTRWKRLRDLCHDVVALRRGDQNAQRLELNRLHSSASSSSPATFPRKRRQGSRLRIGLRL